MEIDERFVERVELSGAKTPDGHPYARVHLTLAFPFGLEARFMEEALFRGMPEPPAGWSTSALLLAQIAADEAKPGTFTPVWHHPQKEGGD